MRTSSLKFKDAMAKDLGPSSFGRFMSMMRASKDLNQTEMAKFLGISKSSLCDIEKGRQHVSVELAAKIARKCGFWEVMAVKHALQDSLYRAGLKMEIEVKASS